ncbi:MAG: metallophosphoesterase [Deltaproteobacteria bacterium]|jgi:hypothetical protein|nr:metallophosphoesterase [Deltaproteobacteria bacterium]
MIWVIGDIHGRLDPLVSLFNKLPAFYKKNTKLIFLGDYFDAGASSRAVLDTLIDWPGNKVFLAGDYEDLLLRFINKDDSFLEYYPRQWRPNPLADLYSSIFGQKEGQEFRQRFKAWPEAPDPRAEWEWLKSHAPTLPDKYLNFFQNLKYLHRETFELEDEEQVFTFCHGLPRPSQSLEGLVLDNFADFNAYLKTLSQQRAAASPNEPAGGSSENDLFPLEKTFLRGQEYDFTERYPVGVIVHGHFPTIGYPDFFPDFFAATDKIKSQFSNFLQIPGLPFLFSNQAGAGYLLRDTKESGYFRPPYKTYTYEIPEGGSLAAINVDSGLGSGGCLTAIGLPNFKDISDGIEFISVKSNGNYRMNEVIEYGVLNIYNL